MNIASHAVVFRGVVLPSSPQNEQHTAQTEDGRTVIKIKLFLTQLVIIQSSEMTCYPYSF